LNINEDVAHRKTISRRNVTKIKIVGKCLFKTKCKWEMNVGGGETQPPLKVRWKPKCKMRKLMENRNRNAAVVVVSVVIVIVTEPI
jgi:hypothetical protein